MYLSMEDMVGEGVVVLVVEIIRALVENFHVADVGLIVYGKVYVTVMVFLVGRCRGGVPVEMTGVTGDQHLCSGTVSSGQKKKVDNECLDCCFVIRGDRRRCVKNGRKGSVKAGGFGFGTVVKVKERLEKQHGVNIMALAVQIEMALDVAGEEVVGPGRAEMVVNVSSGVPRCYGCCEESKAVELEKTLDVTEVMVGCPGKALNIDVNEDIND
nr:hypothetical protein [Tanacetum cinerariifolium]